MGEAEPQLVRVLQREEEKMTTFLIPALCHLLRVLPIGQTQTEARGQGAWLLLCQALSRVEERFAEDGEIQDPTAPSGARYSPSTREAELGLQEETLASGWSLSILDRLSSKAMLNTHDWVKRANCGS